MTASLKRLINHDNSAFIHADIVTLFNTYYGTAWTGSETLEYVLRKHLLELKKEIKRNEMDIDSKIDNRIANYFTESRNTNIKNRSGYLI